MSILVIEQGPDNYEVPEVVYPALYPRNLFPTSKLTLFWEGNKSPQLADRNPIVPSGGTLGGGSSINWMVYTRAQRSDFDSWNAPGWSANELFPFLKKVSPPSDPLTLSSRSLLHSSRRTTAMATRRLTAIAGLSTSPAAPTEPSAPRAPSSTPLTSSATTS